MIKIATFRNWILFFWVLSVFSVQQACADEDFQEYLNGVRSKAVDQGVSRSLIKEALPKTMVPEPSVWEKLVKQPESVFSFKDYFSRLVSKDRVANGKAQIRAHKPEILKASKTYKVDPQVIVALWGIETAYGRLPGDNDLIQSLASLGYKSHRRDFFERELLHALTILDEGHIGLKEMKGSWAGAMGQVQFMPSSFLRYAADGDDDGKKDLWQNKSDVFASAANYLSSVGWKQGEKWGERVVLTKYLPKNIPFSDRGMSEPKPLSYWKKIGLVAVKGGFAGKKRTDTARLFMPEGPSKRVYLVYDNFDVILRWNRSSYFAFSVLSLSDRLKSAF